MERQLQLGDKVEIAGKTQARVVGTVGALDGNNGTCIVRFGPNVQLGRDLTGWIPQASCKYIPPPAPPVAPETAEQHEHDEGCAARGCLDDGNRMRRTAPLIPPPGKPQKRRR